MKHLSKLIYTVSVFTILFTQQLTADVVVLDDQIISGSQCVGESCTADEFAFDPMTGQTLIGPFDTLRIKAPAPVLSFIDTSTSAAFPSVDWALGVQDSAVETSYFFVKDLDTDVDVLKMSASAMGGVALGANSELIDNTISVGAAGSERIISHVADGVAPNDAVTKGQFDAFTATVPNLDATLAGFNTQLTTIESDLTALSSRIDAVIVRLDALP